MIPFMCLSKTAIMALLKQRFQARLQALKESWWTTLTESEKEKYHDFPAYIRMRNYVESGGKVEALQSCTLKIYSTSYGGNVRSQRWCTPGCRVK